MKTSRMRPDEAERRWVLFDANGKTLGRLAVDIAVVLAGKNKPSYQPDIEMGDYVVVVNADKIVVTGNKLQDKRYYRHSGYVGGIKSRTLREQLTAFPDRPIRDAVKGMLPKNKLRDRLMTRLHIYGGATHPHQAQQPTQVESAYGY